MKSIAFVRRPSPQLGDGLVTHIERTEVDVRRAAAQWDAYNEVLRSREWTVHELSSADEHPDGVFIEDAAVVFGDRVVITRPGAPERRGETSGLSDQFARHGLEPIDLPDGSLDGGDVLKIGQQVYVGVGGRTSVQGVEALQAVLGSTWHVHAVPVTRVLHLKSAVTALPDGTVIGFQPLVDDPSVFNDFLAMPEESGAHVVLLGGNALLMAASAPASADMLSARGWDPICVDISEFERLEGCVTCLSVRYRRG